MLLDHVIRLARHAREHSAAICLTLVITIGPAVYTLAGAPGLKSLLSHLM